LQALQEFDFEIVHCNGRLHNNADALSCVPCEQCGQDPACDQVTSTSLIATITLTAQLDLQLTQLQSKDPKFGPIIEGKKTAHLSSLKHWKVTACYNCGISCC